MIVDYRRTKTFVDYNIARVIVECNFQSIGIQTDVLVIGSAQASDGITVGNVNGTCETSREGIRHCVDSGRSRIRSRVVGHLERRIGGKNGARRRRAGRCCSTISEAAIVLGNLQ